MATVDEQWMSRALQLVAKGNGHVAPNPMVGAVLVHPQWGLVSEGWHRKFGGPHAEVDCLAPISDQKILSESTLYVTLEPCSHTGKTPPCADLIVQKKIAKVVVACEDPNPTVSGRGINQLKEAGVEIVFGVLEESAKQLNRHFFSNQKNKRPFVTLKWAETADGYLARKDGSSKWISSTESRSLVHQMRASHQSIWAGRNTLRVDNPSLNVRSWSGQSPIRLVMDPGLRLPPSLQVFTDGLAPTWIFNSLKEEKVGNQVWLKSDSFELISILEELSQKGIQSIFVEGGSQLIQQFLDKSIWDEACVFQSPVLFHTGRKAPVLTNSHLKERFLVGPDWLSIFNPVSG